MIAIVTFRSVKMCQYLQNVQQIHQLNSSLIQVSSIFILAVKHNELDKTDEVRTYQRANPKSRVPQLIHLPYQLHIYTHSSL